ncbi:transposase [Rickettsia endosymbiont of Urophora cardui]|uniref:transposase n=1 Tax=Rickettsia endosymbiont of Urophora cardui TaxID=3066265 RepID=UPI00397BFEE9
MKIRCLFGLKLRQTQGFINWLFEISGFSIRCPDYTTLSKRMKSLDYNGLKKLDKKMKECVSAIS